MYNAVDYVVSRALFENEEEEQLYKKMNPALGAMVFALTFIIFLFLVSMGGVHLWNKGLVPVFQNMFLLPIDGRAGQLKNPQMQLLTTLFALMMLYNFATLLKR